MTAQLDAILQAQIDYYRARAGEYDQWFLRQGRFDRGEELNQLWFKEAAQVRQALDDFQPQGEILELACGTGLWTQQLNNHADFITAVDASPEVIALNRQHLQSPKVTYVEADLFQWQPDRQYDLVFFSFWLSHVPEQKFEKFWVTLRSALKPQGRFFLVDSRYEPTSTAINHNLGEVTRTIRERKLNDGRSFQIVKVFYEATKLANRLNRLGWQANIQETANYFVYGSGG